MTSRSNARTIRATQAVQALTTLRERRQHQDARLQAHFEAVSAAEAAQARMAKAKEAGDESVAKARTKADARVAKAQHEALPAAEAVRTALALLADGIGETQTAELLGMTPREIRSATRSRRWPAVDNKSKQLDEVAASA